VLEQAFEPVVLLFSETFGGRKNDRMESLSHAASRLFGLFGHVAICTNFRHRLPAAESVVD
jgi:hypothetical protein